MILVFGGAYQGKLDFVLKHFQLTMADVTYCKEGCLLENEKKVIYGLERWVLGELQQGREVLPSLQKQRSQLEDKIIIAEDMSCGVVPMTSIERRWLRETGAVLQWLAKDSQEVYRLYCGLWEKIKG